MEGAIAAEDDEPRAPRRNAVRVMHDLCEWLLGLGLPKAARRALAVAEESEKLAVKKAKARISRGRMTECVKVVERD